MDVSAGGGYVEGCAKSDRGWGVMEILWSVPIVHCELVKCSIALERPDNA